VDGWFETGTLKFQETAQCPECGGRAFYAEHIQGQTTRHLPFASRPRLTSESNGSVWQVTTDTGIVTRPKDAKQSQRRGGSRSTGRPRRATSPDQIPGDPREQAPPEFEE
jgi:hypothetical protein